MLHVCEEVLKNLDLFISPKKSVCMRMGPRFNMSCCAAPMALLCSGWILSDIVILLTLDNLSVVMITLLRHFIALSMQFLEK